MSETIERIKAALSKLRETTAQADYEPSINEVLVMLGLIGMLVELVEELAES